MIRGSRRSWRGRPATSSPTSRRRSRRSTDAPPRPECATALGGVAVKAYERVPRVGARDEHLGNAVVAVLGGLGAAGAVELERLWGRTSYFRARKRIEAALKVARRAAARGEGVADAAGVGRARGARVDQRRRGRARTRRRTCVACARRGWGPTGGRAPSRPAAAAKASAGERDRLEPSAGGCRPS